MDTLEEYCELWVTTKNKSEYVYALNNIFELFVETYKSKNNIVRDVEISIYKAFKGLGVKGKRELRELKTYKNTRDVLIHNVLELNSGINRAKKREEKILKFVLQYKYLLNPVLGTNSVEELVTPLEDNKLKIYNINGIQFGGEYLDTTTGEDTKNLKW